MVTQISLPAPSMKIFATSFMLTLTSATVATSLSHSCALTTLASAHSANAIFQTHAHLDNTCVWITLALPPLLSARTRATTAHRTPLTHSSAQTTSAFKTQETVSQRTAALLPLHSNALMATATLPHLTLAAKADALPPFSALLIHHTSALMVNVLVTAHSVRSNSHAQLVTSDAMTEAVSAANPNAALLSVHQRDQFSVAQVLALRMLSTVNKAPTSAHPPSHTAALLVFVLVLQLTAICSPLLTHHQSP